MDSTGITPASEPNHVDVGIPKVLYGLLHKDGGYFIYTDKEGITRCPCFVSQKIGEAYFAYFRPNIKDADNFSVSRIAEPHKFYESCVASKITLVAHRSPEFISDGSHRHNQE